MNAEDLRTAFRMPAWPRAPYPHEEKDFGRTALLVGGEEQAARASSTRTGLPGDSLAAPLREQSAILANHFVGIPGVALQPRRFCISNREDSFLSSSDKYVISLESWQAKKNRRSPQR